MSSVLRTRERKTMANPGKALASDSEDDEDRVEDVPESGKEVDRDEPAAKKVRGWIDGDETGDEGMI